MYSPKLSASGNYVNECKLSAIRRINALVAQGVTYIRLHDDLYKELHAKTKAEQTAVRMAVREAKANGILVKTKIDTIYGVCIIQ